MHPAIVPHLAWFARPFVRLPEVQNALAAQNYEVADTGPEDFPAYVRRDCEKWAKVIARTGVKADQETGYLSGGAPGPRLRF